MPLEDLKRVRANKTSAKGKLEKLRIVKAMMDAVGPLEVSFGQIIGGVLSRALEQDCLSAVEWWINGR